MNTFCAINIIDSDGSLINNDNRPLMYIWDGKTDLWDQISKDQNFVHYLMKELDILHNFKNYAESKIVSFIYKKNIDSEPHYENKDITIQEMFPLSSNKNIGYIILAFIMNKLYRLSFKEFSAKPENESYERYIYWIYGRIKDKYKDKLTDETIIEAVRNICQTDIELELLRKENVDEIVKLIKNILKNERI